MMERTITKSIFRNTLLWKKNISNPKCIYRENILSIKIEITINILKYKGLHRRITDNVAVSMVCAYKLLPAQYFNTVMLVNKSFEFNRIDR